jgi:hypothetical protein
MGFLDKLLGRKKEQPAEGMQTAPPPASMPADEPHEHSHGEGEGEGEHSHDEPPSGPPA